MLQDWAIEKQRQAEAARRRAAKGGRGGGGGGGGDDYLYPTVTNVELDTGDGGGGAAEDVAEDKVVPPWMLRDGVDRTGGASILGGGARLLLALQMMCRLLCSTTQQGDWSDDISLA